MILDSAQVCTLFSHIKSLADQGARDGYPFGLSKPEVDLLRSNRIWLVSDRIQVQALLTRVVYAAFEMTGIPHYTLPAEWRALVISRLVHPVNHFAASQWSGQQQSAEQIMEGDALDEIQVSPSQLLSMVMTCNAQCAEHGLMLDASFKHVANREEDVA